MAFIRTLAFAGLTIIASAGAAAAQGFPVQANPFYGLRQAPLQIAFASDAYRYDRSGTRGRLELGASPFHPEGPGNPED